MNTLHRLATIGFIACSTAVAHAHEFWIRPDTFTVRDGQPATLRIFNGERFIGNPLPRNTPMISRFESVSPLGKAHDVLGRHGSNVSLVRLSAPGTHRIVYESMGTTHTMTPDDFRAYLMEEKLDRVLPAFDARRAERDGAGVRETYTRCAKSLIRVSGKDNVPSTPDDLEDRNASLPLEIVVRTHLTKPNSEDEAQTQSEDEPTIRIIGEVTYLGRPLADMRVVAARASDPELLIEARTDAEGRVAFDGAVPGVWMLTTLHMVPGTATSDADWLSFWASTTFEIPNHAPDSTKAKADG